jgi:hypothetical protein
VVCEFPIEVGGYCAEIGAGSLWRLRIYWHGYRGGTIIPFA